DHAAPTPGYAVVIVSQLPHLGVRQRAVHLERAEPARLLGDGRAAGRERGGRKKGGEDERTAHGVSREGVRAPPARNFHRERVGCQSKGRGRTAAIMRSKTGPYDD